MKIRRLIALFILLFGFLLSGCVSNAKFIKPISFEGEAPEKIDIIVEATIFLDDTAKLTKIVNDKNSGSVQLIFSRENLDVIDLLEDKPEIGRIGRIGSKAYLLLDSEIMEYQRLGELGIVFTPLHLHLEPNSNWYDTKLKTSDFERKGAKYKISASSHEVIAFIKSNHKKLFAKVVGIYLNNAGVLCLEKIATSQTPLSAPCEGLRNTIKAKQEEIQNIKASTERYKKEDQVKKERLAEIARKKQEAEQRARETEKKQRQVRAENLAEQFGKYIVGKKYEGGSSIKVKLQSFDYSQSRYRLKVEMTWRGVVSNEPGYGADGVITAIIDDSPRWEYGSNVMWQETWKSQQLKSFQASMGLLQILAQ